MDDIYKNIEEYNPDKKRNILIVFDDIIADILTNKKVNPIVTKLYITRYNIEHAPTESKAGGCLLYISEKNFYKL